MSIEQAAKAAHEANRIYCEAMGDFSQVRWEQAPEWQRQSCVLGVKFIIDNPGATPIRQHDSWLVHKRAAGWKYGPNKDAEKKTDPCFVPYDKLPVAQQYKDTIFAAVVRGMLHHHGLMPD